MPFRDMYLMSLTSSVGQKRQNPAYRRLSENLLFHWVEIGNSEFKELPTHSSVGKSSRLKCHAIWMSPATPTVETTPPSTNIVSLALCAMPLVLTQPMDATLPTSFLNCRSHFRHKIRLLAYLEDNSVYQIAKFVLCKLKQIPRTPRTT